MLNSDITNNNASTDISLLQQEPESTTIILHAESNGIQLKESQVPPLPDSKIEKLLKWIPRKGVKMHAQMLVLAPNQIESIKKSISRCTKCAQQQHNNVNFFRTALVEPAFQHYLNEVRMGCGRCATCFIEYFRGEKNELKFEELSSYFMCFVLKSKRYKLKKKGKDKPVSLEFDSGSLSTMIKCIFS